MNDPAANISIGRGTSTGVEAAAAPTFSASIEHAVGPLHVESAVDPGPFLELAAMCPLGVFDSGVGGLSIVEELRRELPAEDITYYADTANCPYGVKTDRFLRERSLQIAGFLLEQGAKAIVVACNTASAAGLEHLRAAYSVPIVGLVPAVKPAVAASRSRIVGVLATQGTNRGRLLSDVIDRFAAPAGVEVVTSAPGELVAAVEAGAIDTPETEEAVRRAVAPMVEQGADVLVLGCTHYPFLKEVIRRVAGDGVLIVDSGQGVSRQTRRVLQGRRLLRSEHEGVLTVFTSGNPEQVGPVVRRLTRSEVEVTYSPGEPTCLGVEQFMPGLAPSTSAVGVDR
ncbi:MAG TPA: glutamate racemase [Chloroflexia bacterium]|nr:glutamate racemase [Chloroflexia bacterium]